MSPWIATRVYARLRNVNHRTRSYRDPGPRADSGPGSSSFLSSLTSTLRTAGLLPVAQPSGDAPSGWLVLSTFIGLPVALWVYKCLILVIFQRKMIYMGYVPPGSRTEVLGDVYHNYYCDDATRKGIRIEELSIPSSQPNTIRLSTLLLRRDDSDVTTPPDHVIVYCQGNAGNPLHRIPVFATLLNAVPSSAILAPAPRSYWTSSSSPPTQPGLIADYTSALTYAASRFPTSRLTIYGHSLGASIALCLLCLPHTTTTTKGVHGGGGLVLENPFTSVPDMLRALYPQRWLPYRYLGPFVRDRWDARAAALVLPRCRARRAMVLVSERDEVVPPAMGREIFDALWAPRGMEKEEGRDDGVGGCGRMREPLGRFVVLEGALHEDAWRYREWSRAMKQYLEDLQDEKQG